ncbi:MAG: 2OG-Fe(II) oxygenase [Pararhodobacter sp.]|nr:2OG-Fe(II) oxygenase [Pararhodobacter sp.]
MARFFQRESGDPLGLFTAASASKAEFQIGYSAGRYLLLCFMGSSAAPGWQAAHRCLTERRSLFDDRFASFFGISVDRGQDGPRKTIPDVLPGIRFLIDADFSASRANGALPVDATSDRLQPVGYRRFWMLVDPMLRVIATLPFSGPDGGAGAALDLLAAQPPVDRYTGISQQAPILFLPRVFEPALCDDLIARYQATGGVQSGFMRAVDGRTVGMHDPSFKSRRDLLIEDEPTIETLKNRVLRRVVPEIAKAHMFNATRMERYLVACYDSREKGHFAPHRDNTTPGTAHRRFAISVNLNDDFDGGAVSFPEFGPKGYRAPKGGAVVFACALLHAVSPVTRGARYAFLPFVYDEAAVAVRERNLHTVDNTGALPETGADQRNIGSSGS